MYISKYILSKKLICSIAVLYFCLKILEKIPPKEFNVSIKVLSVEPATILKNELFNFLFFVLFDHDCRRTILENTFQWLLSERFIPGKVLTLGKMLVTTFLLISSGHKIRSI